MIMKKLFIMLFFNNLFVYTLISQTFIQRIEDAYKSLDSISYIENFISSYEEHLVKLNRKTEDVMLELRGVDYDNMDFVQRQKLDSIRGKTIVLSYREDLTKKKVWEEIHAIFGRSIASAYLNLDGSVQQQYIYDSIARDFTKIGMERDYSMFISAIKDKPVHYVLNLRVDSCNQSDKHMCLLPDTSKLLFNLFCFGKNYKDGIYIYCEGGQYSWQDSRYRTFSRQLGVNAPKVFRKIIKKNPKYLLYCSELEGMNTILYVLNDKIYVYRIAQMKEYKLDDYVKKFMLPIDGILRN
jgi:hypothetical protein